MVERFCVTCAWCDQATKRCLHAQALNPKGSDAYAAWLVSGEGPRPAQGSQFLCIVMRKCDCGAEGKFWQPIPAKAAA